ncbi:hypothetical protein EJ06DRAFT_85673 [Trichodelitschia bisporula]|uniref:Uncharacterized protein n=1 Tax=Trichodelitschia bisporula TaxID=703511 RepID=A0A6G1HRD4_9PEZI|nr:hypothetical protein EJ06DRAFT_85673 [Trichodelitschia bisporula]
MGSRPSSTCVCASLSALVSWLASLEIRGKQSLQGIVPATRVSHSVQGLTRGMEAWFVVIALGLHKWKALLLPHAHVVPLPTPYMEGRGAPHIGPTVRNLPLRPFLISSFGAFGDIRNRWSETNSHLDHFMTSPHLPSVDSFCWHCISGKQTIRSTRSRCRHT